MKDTSPLVLNLEKIVLGAAGLVLVLVAVYFFVLSPFGVNRGGRTVSPVAFEEDLQVAVDDLEGKLRSSSVPVRQVPNFAEVFTRSFNAELIGADDRLVALMLPGLDTSLVGDGGTPEAPRYALPDPPVATELAARAGFALLDADAIDDPAARSDVLALVGDDAPADFRYVSVVGRFDFPAWDAALAESDIPEGWRNVRRGIARVSLLRQTWNPETRRWGGAVAVDPLPTQLAFGAETTYTRDMAEQFTNRIRLAQRRIAHPDLPPVDRIDGGIAWVSPDVDTLGLTADQLAELHRINAELKAARETIRANVIRLNLDAPPPPPAAAFRPAAEALDRFDEARAPRRPADGRPIARPAERPARRDALGAAVIDDPAMRALQEAQVRVIELRRERRELLESAGDDAGPVVDEGGDDPFDEPLLNGADEDEGPAGLDDPRGPGGPRGPEADAWFDRAVRVWAHDVTVEPGETYRYKLVVGVVNPLFHEDRLADDQREENLNRLVLYPSEAALDAAAWTEPVSVASESSFFLVGGNASFRQAEVEVWRPYAGRWVRERFTRVEPGDKIGGLGTAHDGATLDLTLPALLVDVSEFRRGAQTVVQASYIDQAAADALLTRIDADDRSSDAYRRRALQHAAQERLGP